MKESYDEGVPEVHAPATDKVVLYCFACWSMLPSRNKKTEKKPGPNAAEGWARARGRGVASFDKSLHSGAINQRNVISHLRMAFRETEHHYLAPRLRHEHLEPRMRTQWMTSEWLWTRQRAERKYIQFHVLNVEHGAPLLVIKTPTLFFTIFGSHKDIKLHSYMLFHSRTLQGPVIVQERNTLTEVPYNDDHAFRILLGSAKHTVVLQVYFQTKVKPIISFGTVTTRRRWRSRDYLLVSPFQRHELFRRFAINESQSDLRYIIPTQKLT
ncbi:hypothetical protein EDD18DRAFT_1331439 [Armillaria luteobubalina]|uniref:Uncharacterized protein n=1 Tax=Armillaria luteobubalina TaxID=153913 RepID=A0AA39UPZ9_9AGAR|nr:hypothetical protein EDD18DRAFT_1331439 [Armillaria luteobubalina]